MTFPANNASNETTELLCSRKSHSNRDGEVPAATDWSCLMVAVRARVCWKLKLTEQSKLVGDLARKATLPPWPQLMFLPSLQRDQTRSHQSLQPYKFSAWLLIISSCRSVCSHSNICQAVSWSSDPQPIKTLSFIEDENITRDPSFKM